jgi:hypothetical protein
VSERQDKNFRTWFASDDIFRNLVEVIPEVTVTLRGEAALKEMQQTMGTDGAGSTDLLSAGFQLAPSAMTSKLTWQNIKISLTLNQVEEIYRAR